MQLVEQRCNKCWRSCLIASSVFRCSSRAASCRFWKASQFFSAPSFTKQNKVKINLGFFFILLAFPGVSYFSSLNYFFLCTIYLMYLQLPNLPKGTLGGKHKDKNKKVIRSALLKKELGQSIWKEKWTHQFYSSLAFQSYNNLINSDKPQSSFYIYVIWKSFCY